MQRVAAPSANFCAGSSTKAPPLTAPCQIGRTQARRAGGFAAVGGGLRPPPKPALRAGCPAGRPVPAGCLPPASASRPAPAKPPSACRPPLPRHPPAGCRHRAAGRPALRAGPTGARRRGGGCAAGPAARLPLSHLTAAAGPAARLLLSHLTAAAGPAARPPSPSSRRRPNPSPRLSHWESRGLAPFRI